MEIQEKLALIKENLVEVLDAELIERPLAEGRNPRIYWGTATTGKPHCGYLAPAIKIAQFLAAGCDVVLLLADIHGFLDDLKSPLDLVEQRVEYYRLTITSLLRAMGVSTQLKNLTIVQGSSYQKTAEYVMDLYKLSSCISEHEAKRAGAEIVRQSDHLTLSSLLYPLLQVLDEQYLDVDAQFGGLDQRKLFIAAKEWLPKIGYRQVSFNPDSERPEAESRLAMPSDESHGARPPRRQDGRQCSSKIDLLDSPEAVARKIQKATTAPKIIKDNGILALVEFVLLPAAGLSGRREFRVDRDRDGLEPLIYTSVEKLHEDYKNDILKPQTLKPAVAAALNRLLAPIQEDYQASREWQQIALKAYPPPAKKEKKEKKGKKLGTQYPGLKNENVKGLDSGEALEPA